MTAVIASAAKQSPSGCAPPAGPVRDIRTVGAISPRLRRAYFDTVYRAEGTDVRVGRRCPRKLLERLDARTAVFVTAWNPRSRRMPEGWNNRMQRQLRQCLRRFTVIEAEGALRGWREAMLLVAGDPRPLVRLAARFRQRAVVMLCHDHKARLRSLRLC